MNRYERTKDFQRAVEEKLSRSIRPTVWKLIRDALMGEAIHEPYTDEDIDFALPKIKKILKLTDVNHKGDFCPYAEHPKFCQEGICEGCFVYETYVR